MKLNKAARQVTAWIAMFAILLASALPSVSFALTSNANSQGLWSEICSTRGVKLAQEGADTGTNHSSPNKSMMHCEHCPFCFAHSVSFGLPPAPTALIPSANRTVLLPTLFYRSPQPLFIWAPAQSRAPPVFS